jgi:uncharacterized protein YuzE
MRNLSNKTIKNFIENEYGFTKEDIETIMLVTIVFEDGRMGTTIHINDDVFIDCDEDVIFVENDMVELQKEIKELGSFLYKEYEVIAKVEMCLFDGMLEECVF